MRRPGVLRTSHGPDSTVRQFDPRLCEYKAKFAPDVRSHVELERGSLPFRAAAELYTRLR